MIDSYDRKIFRFQGHILKFRIRKKYNPSKQKNEGAIDDDYHEF